MKKLLVLCSFSLTFAQTVRLAVSNAASYQQNSSIEPGTIIAVKGSNLTNVTMSAPNSSAPPTTLGGLTLTVNGVACELYYVSPSQVNAVIDPATPIMTPSVVNLQSPTLTAQASITMQSPASAAVFTLNGTGSGDGAIVNTETGNEQAFSVTTDGGGTYLALFNTSLDTSIMPTVFIGGVSVPVQYFGFPGTYPGMQQINVQLPQTLQGVGRVEVAVQQGTNRSNAVQAVILPNQPVFLNDQPNQVRSRELAAVASIPGTSTALVADENDDVLRVIDLRQQKVTHVIALPSGAMPVAIGMNPTGTFALVAERMRGSVGLIDLTAYDVAAEFPTGLGASAIAVTLDEAVIANSDSDTVSFFNFSGPQVMATVPVGRLPRGVAVDMQYAYVTNESAGTVSVLDLAEPAVVNTFSLGVNARPAAIQLLPDQDLAVIAQPSAGAAGSLIFMKLDTGQFVSVSANPAQTGGASSIAANNDQVYLANQSGASVTTTNIKLLTDTQFVASDVQMNPVNMTAGQGPRSLSIDSNDGWLLTANEGDGTVYVNNLLTNNLLASIDAVRISSSDNTDDHSDRLAAANLPTVTTVAPASASSQETPVNATLVLSGTNLQNASTVLFIDPATVASLAPGLGNVNRGNVGLNDPAFSVTGLQWNSTGTTLTIQVTLAPNTSIRTRVLRVLTPNGETSLTNAPTLAIGPQS
jgi:uncharacterized protein (TIGR03437 family)